MPRVRSALSPDKAGVPADQIGQSGLRAARDVPVPMRRGSAPLVPSNGRRIRNVSRWRSAAAADRSVSKPPRASKQPNYSRKLARRIRLADGRTLTTLHDAREVVLSAFGAV